MEKLKLFFSKIMLEVIKKISVVYIKLENKEKLIKELEKESDSGLLEEKYLSLAPDDDVDINGYGEALESALNNPSVRNIAVSGSYGSGKSSFLRTFENKHDDDKWKYLKISLANFKNKKELTKEVGTVKIDKESNRLTEENNRDIERSILQQILYKVKESKIPNSRFKGIKNVKFKNLIMETISISILILTGVLTLKPEMLKEVLFFKKINILKVIGYYNYEKYYLSFVLGIFLIVSIIYLYRIIKYMLEFEISKLSLKNSGIELNKKSKSSILNDHLDEILYFFEVTDYNVVIFEDLDRFDNTEIFVKLREINSLINNSDEINKKVVFIYAIRDDMFSDRERVKFFEYIIPIIPYINSSTSKQKLIDLFTKEETIEDKISDEFIEDISFYIDDMRLLKNIKIEYDIYSKKIEKIPLKENLLAMIVYKNFYPKDFSDLHYKKGMVYKVFENKLKTIKEKTEIINQEIKDLKDKIIPLERETIEDIQELRVIYVFAVIKNINNSSVVRLDNRNINISLLDEDNNFSVLKKEKNISYYNNGWKNTNKSFKEIEKSISDLSYDEREELIRGKQENRIEEIKKEIEKKEELKRSMLTLNLEKLIRKFGSVDIFDEYIKEEKILRYLIRNGYINEDYYMYISYFFEGSITREEQEFIKNVKSGISSIFSYKLINLDEVVKKLSIWDFEDKPILNFSLLDYLIGVQNKEREKYNKFFKHLIDESEESINFIFEYIDVSEQRGKFIQELASKLENLWIYIEEKSNFTTERVNKYLTWILEYSEIKDIERLNINSSLKNYIEKQEKLLSITDKKYQQVMEALNIKFKCISNLVENQEMFDYIYENNCYQFNENMINHIILNKRNEGLGEELKIAHLTAIRGRKGLEKLNDYIYSYLDEYIEKVFLKVESNVEESMETIIWLLNKDDVSDENKIEIIRKENQKIDDVEKINNSELWTEIVKNNRIVVSWKNLFVYHEDENSNDDILFDYLNKNYNILSKSKISFIEKELEEKVSERISFTKKIILSEKITEEAYEYLIKSIPWSKYPSLSIDNLSIEKINILLKSKIFEIDQENINSLKEHFPDKHVSLIENLIEDYLKKFEEIELEGEDYIKLLKSKKLEISNKLQIFKKMDKALIEEFVDEFIDIVIKNTESYNNLFDLLNIEDLLKKNKIKIIEEVDEIIDDIEEIKDSTLWSEIIKNNKMKPCWNNLLAVYSSEGLDEDILIKYLNKEEIFKVLSEEVLKNEEEYDLEAFILESNKINDIAYSFLAQSFTTRWEVLDISKLSISKINTLFECKFLTMNEKIVNDLKESFPDKHIEFLENHIEEYLEEFDKINLEGKDYTKLLKSEKLEVSEKLVIIKKLDMGILNGNNELIFEISKIYIANPEEIDKELSRKLLELLITQIQYLSKKEIDNYIGLAGEEYKGISYLENGRVVYIDNTEKNEKLAKELNKRRYISSFSINKNDEIKINKYRKN